MILPLVALEVGIEEVIGGIVLGLGAFIAVAGLLAIWNET